MRVNGSIFFTARFARAAKIAESILYYFFSVKSRKEINPSPSGRMTRNSTVLDTYKTIYFIDAEVGLRNKPCEAKLLRVFIYRPLNGK